MKATTSGKTGNGRLFQFGVSTGLAAGAILAILVLVNGVAAGLNLNMDVSSHQLYTLSASTKAYLAQLKEPVNIYAFYGADQGGPAKMLLNQYRRNSREITLYLVDPLQNPSLAQSYGVQQDGTIVFTSGRRQDKLLDAASGQGAFNAALGVVTGPIHYVYFLTGHGEASPLDGTPGGLSTLALAMGNQGYQVRTLSLLGVSTQGIPADCAALIVADPKVALLPAEEAAIAAYVSRGGNAIYTGEPGDAAYLDPLLAAYGVTLSNNQVADQGQNLRGSDPATPEVTQYPSFSLNITGGLPATYYPTTSAVEVSNGVNANTIEPVVMTSGSSTLGGAKGPFILGAILGNISAGSNVAVFGDTDFMTNAYKDLGNQQLFLQTVEWLNHAKQDLASMSQASVASSSLIMPVAAMQTMFIMLVLFLPLGVLASGGIVWWMRR